MRFKKMLTEDMVEEVRKHVGARFTPIHDYHINRREFRFRGDRYFVFIILPAPGEESAGVLIMERKTQEIIVKKKYKTLSGLKKGLEALDGFMPAKPGRG